MYLLYPYPIFRRLFFPILRLFIKKLEGLENLPEKGPYIVTANHASSPDGYFLAMIIVSRIKKKVHFFSRTAKYGSFLGNWIARFWAGCILVDPDNKGKSVKEAIRFLKKGKVVGIFPEGRSHKDRILKKGKTGVARLVIEARVPVIPVGISSNMATTFEKAFFQAIFRSGRVSISIGKPISFSEYYSQEITKELLEEITGIIMKEVSKLSKLPYPY